MAPERNPIRKAGLLPTFVTGCLLAGAAQADWLEGDTATLQALDKITARISTLSATISSELSFGTLGVTVHRCAFRPPELPPEDAAFLEIVDRGHDPSALPKPVFDGWMFSSSPAVSALEHPVYDITLLSCKSD
jgi:hypothetical protein